MPTHLAGLDVLGAPGSVLRHAEGDLEPGEDGGCAPALHGHRDRLSQQAQLLGVALLGEGRPRAIGVECLVRRLSQAAASAAAAEAVRRLAVPRAREHPANGTHG